MRLFLPDFQTAWKVGNSVAGWVMIICLSNHRASREYGKQQHAIFKLKEESSATAPLEWLIKTLGLCELLFIHAGCHLGPPSFQKKRAIFMRLLFTRHSKTVAASGLSASAKLCMLLTQGRKSIIQEWKPNTISSSVPLPLQGDDEFIINTSAGEMEKLSTVQVLMKKTFPIPGASLMT